MGNVTDHEAAFRRDVLEPAIRKRLQAAAITVANHAKELVSTEGTGAGFVDAMPKTPGGKRRFKWRARIYNLRPSAPGEPPHKQKGHLRRSITWELDPARLVARVGTNLKYGRWLELGTAFMAARPWLRRALAECRSKIKTIFSK